MTFRPYAEHGWKLCRLKSGEKGPTYRDWSKPARAIAPDQAEHLEGAGLMHAFSGTCALDIDNYDQSKAWLAEKGVDLDALFAAPDRVEITSGTANRGKLLYALPQPLRTKKVLNGEKDTLFELRCADAKGGTVQDVLPPSIHPSGRKYAWRYGPDVVDEWRTLPELPEGLRRVWLDMIEPIVEKPVDRAEVIASTTDEETALAILAQHDPDCDYDTWLKIGMALENDLGAERGFELWDAWSAKGSKYPGHEELAVKFDSFKGSDNPVTLGQFKIRLKADKSLFDDLDLNPPAEIDVFAEAKAERISAMKLWTLADIKALPWPEWIIRDVLPKAEILMIYGPSGSGKSFIVLDMALAVAQGIPWWEHDVRGGGVLWLAAEAFGSMKPRTAAYGLAKEVNVAEIENFYVVEQFNLSNAETVDTLIEAVKDKQLKMVVVDTLAAASGGVNENSGEDMGAILDACRKIYYATRASVLLIHHSGKNAELGARGWSGIRAAVQAELRVDHDPEEGTRFLTCTKQRDGDENLRYEFALVSHMVGMDDRELPVNSASVKNLGKREHVPTVEGDGNGKRPPKGVNESLLWSLFLEMEPLTEGRGVKADDLIERAKEQMHLPAGGSDNRVKALTNALSKLRNSQHIDLHNGVVTHHVDDEEQEGGDDVSDLI